MAIASNYNLPTKYCANICELFGLVFRGEKPYNNIIQSGSAASYLLILRSILLKEDMIYV